MFSPKGFTTTRWWAIPGFARNWRKRKIKSLWQKGYKVKVWSGTQSIRKNYQHLLTRTKTQASSIKVNSETLQMREERKMMNRILAASRSWSEIFCTYEFSVFHLQIFAPHGSLYYAKDKSVIATQLKQFQPDNTAIGEGEETNNKKVLINGCYSHCKQNRYKSRINWKL